MAMIVYYFFELNKYQFEKDANRGFLIFQF